jgi:hypothetical protein
MFFYLKTGDGHFAPLKAVVAIINNYVSRQEKVSMEFVCKGEMGILEKNTRCLRAVIKRHLSDSELYNFMLRYIKNASMNNGVEKVSDYILSY